MVAGWVIRPDGRYTLDGGVMMPLVKLSMIEGRTLEEKQAVADGVHAALIESFKIRTNDINIRIEEYKKENFILPPGNSEKYILVEITAFKGRSLEAKRSLYKKIIFNLEKIGIDSDDVFIIVYEEPLENWGIRGGFPACDVDLGFKVDV
jgi:phenylpyruvate tautomerase PptA (4-oxalocrotonate tautomerase family)